jgi:hypothetical protein
LEHRPNRAAELKIIAAIRRAPVIDASFDCVRSHGRAQWRGSSGGRGPMTPLHQMMMSGQEDELAYSL